jgi:cellulose synthase/poly-beta-1,6-N-acetylglucosamine synthase-like glycosyltransferase
MYRFSIVVPRLNDPRLFEDTLASVLRYRTDSCQVIVAHNEQYEDPYDLGREVDFVATKRKPHLIRMFNDALRVAKGEFVLLLRPGVQLNENWWQPVLESFQDPDVGSVSPAIVGTKDPSRLVTGGVRSGFSFGRKLVGNKKSLSARRTRKLSPIGPTSWAGFYRRSLLASLGSCDEQLDSLYLDLDLAHSLQNLKFDCVFCPDSVMTIDKPIHITDEATIAHGKSAQRTLLRQNELTPGQRTMKTCIATMVEIASLPLGIENWQHAIQRVGAMKLRDIDRHHWDLISVLNKQRTRLVESGNPLANQESVRNAA